MREDRESYITRAEASKERQKETDRFYVSFFPTFFAFQVGGALSFGFFLGCGMIIRCEEPRGPRGPLSAPGYYSRGPCMMAAPGMGPLRTYGWDRQKQA